MISVVILRRRVAIGLAAVRSGRLALALVILCALVAGLIATQSAPARSDSTATVALPAVQAAALVSATSAAPSQIRALGAEAKIINASLPFSGAAVEAANPFAIAQGDVDHRRALLCLTQTVYYEAGFEPLAGRRAVAQVVLNRMRHPAFPKSVCGVVYQGSRSPVCQFSFVCDGSLHRPPAAGAWRQAHEIAAAALSGHVETAVGAATHYHADYVAPRWAPKLTKIAKLGAHIFYRWPGAWGQRRAFSGRYAGEPHDPLAMRPALRSVQRALPGGVISVGAVEVGPPVARAANDVGGLLDTSKGWTLTIPVPSEINRHSSRAVASQETGARVTVQVMAATAVPAGTR